MNFSILIPAYNVEKYIGRCLDSVINQIYSSYEIIIVNDGSTDNTLNICRQYAKKYNYIKIINKENDGLYMARYDAISIASGDYLVFVDSDDYVEPTLLQELYLSIQNHPDIDMVIYKEYINYEETNSEIEGISLFYKTAIVSNNDVLHTMANSTVVNNVWKKCVKNYRNYELPVLHKFNNAEDVVYSACFLDRCKSILYLNKPLYHYYINNNSISKNLMVKDLISSAIAREKLYEVFYKNKEYQSCTLLINEFVKIIASYFRKFDRNYVSSTEFKEQMEILLNSKMVHIIDDNISSLSKSKKIIYLLLKKRQFRLIQILINALYRKG